jgi:hypothetical protein
VSEPRLHLDADTSRKALYRTLLDLGHDVTRTPNPWMPIDASDEEQLMAATDHGRCLFTYNIRDFLALAHHYPQHGGIILVSQQSLSLTEMIRALNNLLSNTQANDWPGQVRWLRDWL